MSYPNVRPRRLRRTAALRRLVAETRVHPAELVLPMFVKEGLKAPRPIASLPGVVQHSRESLRKAAAEAVQAGIGGLMLFGVPLTRDEVGSGATDPDGILNLAITDVKAEVGDAVVVMSDLCLDEFTSHGHCGVLAPDGTVDNDATLERYAEMAVVQASAGIWSARPG
jgi:porphobilinogen synthase